MTPIENWHLVRHEKSVHIRGKTVTGNPVITTSIVRVAMEHGKCAVTSFTGSKYNLRGGPQFDALELLSPDWTNEDTKAYVERSLSKN